ncbi:hypothetical protein AX16_008974 [Volvariella volvacea WC 439]|nr:hypothetical protein AX16_008974 [Volvariella volvacea WC 439]
MSERISISPTASLTTRNSTSNPDFDKEFTALSASPTPSELSAVEDNEIILPPQMTLRENKVALGRQYGITHWLKDAYRAICTRKAPLTKEEGWRLGVDEVVAIAEARQVLLWESPTTRDDEQDEVVTRVFGLEVALGITPTTTITRKDSLEPPPKPFITSEIQSALPPPADSTSQTHSENSPTSSKIPLPSVVQQVPTNSFFGIQDKGLQEQIEKISMEREFPLEEPIQVSPQSTIFPSMPLKQLESRFDERFEKFEKQLSQLEVHIRSLGPRSPWRKSTSAWGKPA